MARWYDDDQFWAAMEPALFFEGRLAAAPADVEAIVGLLDLSPGARVLDLCCGPARHAIELARRGFRVTGVDRNRAYLERAREAVREAGVELELVEQDMRRFVRPGAFDVVINMYTSFGYFEDERENELVIQNIQRSLCAGGVLLIEIAGKEVLAREWRPRWWADVDGVLLLEQRAVDEDWQRLESRWIVVREGQRSEYTVRHRVYSGIELKTVLLAGGFASVELYGTLDGAPYNHEAKRLVAIARNAAVAT